PDGSADAPGTDGAVTRDATERVERALAEAGLEATVVASKDRFVDVLPKRASKGRAVQWLERVFGLHEEDLAVAGDSGNDREMLVGRHAGIAVGNHAPELQSLAGRPGITFVEGEMAAGVLEGLQALGWMADVEEPTATRGRAGSSPPRRADPAARARRDAPRPRFRPAATR